jgi:Na+/proline symporter
VVFGPPSSTGVLPIAFGSAMFSERRATAGAARAGLLMTLLTAVLYVPQFFLAGSVGAPE